MSINHGFSLQYPAFYSHYHLVKEEETAALGEYVAYMEESSIDVNNVTGMQELQADHYVHGTVQYGVYRGMRQEESAIDAEVFMCRAFNTEESALFESCSTAEHLHGQNEIGNAYVSSGNGLFYDKKRSLEHADMQILKAIGLETLPYSTAAGVSGIGEPISLVARETHEQKIESPFSQSTETTTPPAKTSVTFGVQKVFSPIQPERAAGQGQEGAASPSVEDLERMSVFGRYRALSRGTTVVDVSSIKNKDIVPLKADCGRGDNNSDSEREQVFPEGVAVGEETTWRESSGVSPPAITDTDLDSAREYSLYRFESESPISSVSAKRQRLDTADSHEASVNSAEFNPITDTNIQNAYQKVDTPNSTGYSTKTQSGSNAVGNDLGVGDLASQNANGQSVTKSLLALDQFCVDCNAAAGPQQDLLMRAKIYVAQYGSYKRYMSYQRCSSRLSFLAMITVSSNIC